MTFSGCPTANDGAGRRVAAVCARRRVAERDRSCERLVADCSGPSAVADCLQFAVPAGCRQPHFNLDVRIGGRLARQRDTTERRRRCHRASEGRRNASARNRRRRSKRACGDDRRRRDGRILQSQGGQPLARHRRGGWTLLRGRQQCKKDGDSCDPGTLHTVSFAAFAHFEVGFNVFLFTVYRQQLFCTVG